MPCVSLQNCFERGATIPGVFFFGGEGGGGWAHAVLAFKQKVGDIKLRWYILDFLKFFLNGFVVGKMVMYMYNGNPRELLKAMGYVEYFF